MANILVVDDSMVARKMIIKILVNAGHKIVAEASSGENAIILYEKHKPDIVTMDMDMPGISGAEAARQILKNYSDAVIIHVTAHDSDEISNNYGYIVKKPVNELQLLESIKKVLDKSSDIKPISSEQSFHSASDSIKQIDNLEKVKLDPDIDDNSTENLLKDLNLQVGNAVSIRHYSAINPLKSTITEINPNTLTLKLTKDFVAFNLYEYDPIVVGFCIDNEVFISESIIKSIDSKSSTFKVKITSILNIENNIIFERFPVSLYIDIRNNISKNKNIAIIKNISNSGMSIVSSTDFEIGQKLSFDFFMNSNVLQLDAEVLLKEQKEVHFEYGLKTVFRDISSRESIKLYLQVLKKEQDDIIKKTII